ncbi:hypothetical protein ABZ366_17035, partial [Streptomyces sp. NPDC005904]|uniref:hypothetical protein n=1 Tax=Streptomyces sp. NPDC005904 TaxID=3154570 RepID=UPI0033CE4A5F
GMLVIEDILGRVAPRLGLDPMELRERNFYRPPHGGGGRPTRGERPLPPSPDAHLSARSHAHVVRGRLYVHVPPRGWG